MSPGPYKHMSAVEMLVWDAFQREHGNEWDSWEYDLRVGLGRHIDPTLAPYVQEGLRKVSTHRLDAFGAKGSTGTIFEVKDVAGRGAIGAVELYAWLWNREHPDTPPVSTAIVAARVHPEVSAYLGAHGVKLYLYPFAHTPTHLPPRPQ